MCVSHSTGQHTRERERKLRASESAEQRESRLAKQRVRDTARRAAQSTVQRERALQQRRERFTEMKLQKIERPASKQCVSKLVFILYFEF